MTDRGTTRKTYGMKLGGRRIIITGGASGLGLELVRQLYGDNELIVMARPSPGLQNLRQAFPKAAVFEVDLSCTKQVAACADRILERYDHVEGLINNAAVQHTPTYVDDEFRHESIASEVNVNLIAPCLLCAKLLPALQKAPAAFILNVNSGLALVPKTSSAVYCATKGGLNIFSQSLANQLENTNIKVMQVFLPMVDTPMTMGRGSGKLQPEDAASRIISGIRKGRAQIDIGKVRLLRPIARFLPPLARRIMKTA